MQVSAPAFHLTTASRLNGLDLSEIVQISERAAQLRTEGHDIVALSTGEPDLPTPDHIIDAAHAAARAGQTRYTPTAGTPALRTAVANRADVEMPNVMIATGAKQVIANAMLATLNDGDEVIMPAPFWTSYADIVRLAGGVPVIVPCGMDAGFKLAPDALAAALTAQTRWLMLNSPSNPSGAVYSAEEIAALATVLDAHPDVMVLADEIYRELCYVPFASFTQAAPGLRDRTLIVDGVSKAFSMTGWRIGWGIGPAALISAMIKVQGQVTSGACSVSQAAALAAVTGDQSLLDDRRAMFQARRDMVVGRLDSIEGLQCPVPDGAFYAFPSCAGLLADAGGPFNDDAALCAWLLDTAGVAVVPGRAFGLSGHLRLSFAYSDADLGSALARITDALERKLT
jgi:aspartate aminotransferase